VLVTAARNGFTFAAAASGLSNLAIDGQSHTANTAVTVNNALATVSASDLGITNFRLDGIAVSAGALAIGKGVSVTGSGIAAAAHDGLHVTGGRVTVTVPAGSTATRFDGNTNHGIEVNTTGGITIAGVAGTNGVGTVTANSNTVNGVFIQQTAGAAVAVNRVSGLVAWANRANGLRVYGGSALVLRRSYLLANLTDGVLVSTGAGATGNDLTKMDLGIATDFGHNTFQALPGNNPNFGAGICLSLGNNVNQTLRAEGNIYSGPIDCSTSTATLLRNTTCSGAVDVSSTRNLPRIDVLNCL
jgi:hypothetical protein